MSEQQVKEELVISEFEGDEVSNESQFLSFTLANETYGVKILAVEEIRVWVTPTILPNSPSYIKGVINLRGMIVPVMDLRLRFGVGEASYTATTVVIILQTEKNNHRRQMGIVVDSVADVISIDPEQLEPAPDMRSYETGQFVENIVNIDARVMSVLNTDRLLELRL